MQDLGPSSTSAHTWPILILNLKIVTGSLILLAEFVNTCIILKSQPEVTVNVCDLTAVDRPKSSGLRKDFTAAAAAASLPSGF